MKKLIVAFRNSATRLKKDMDGKEIGKAEEDREKQKMGRRNNLITLYDIQVSHDVKLLCKEYYS